MIMPCTIVLFTILIEQLIEYKKENLLSVYYETPQSMYLIFIYKVFYVTLKNLLDMLQYIYLFVEYFSLLQKNRVLAHERVVSINDDR